MASPTVSRNLNIYIDNTQAQKALDQLTTKAAKLETNIKQVEAAGGDATKEMQKLGQVNGQIKTLSDSLDKGLNKSLRDMQNELKSVEAQMKRATDPADIQRLQGVWKSLKDQTTQYQQALFKVKDAQNSLKQTFQTVGGTLKGLLLFGGGAGAISAITQGVINLAKESFQLSLQAKGVKIAFDRLNDPDLLGNLRKATKGTVSDLELMKRAVSANNFRIPLEQLGTYLKFAQQRARDTGQSVDFLVDSIITGLGRKSPPILDNLGISQVELREQIAKTGDIFKGVAAIINESFKAAGEETDLAADKIDRYNAALDNLKVKLGNVEQWLVVSLSNVLNAPMDAVKQNTEAQEFIASTKKNPSWLQRLFGNTQDNIDAKNNVEKFTKYLRDQLKAINDQATPTEKTIAGITSEMNILNQQLQTLPVGSKSFLSTQARIKELKAELDKINGSDSKSENKAAEKIKADREKLVQDLKRIEDELTHYYDNEVQKRIHTIELKYAKEAELAHGNRALLERIEQDKNKELLLLQQDYLQKAADAMEKSKVKIITTYSEIYKEVNGLSNGKQLLNEQKDDASKGLAGAVSSYGDGKPVEDPRMAKYHAEIKALNDAYGSVESTANAALTAYQNFDNILQTQEQVELSRAQTLHDKKMKALDEELQHKLITQQEYNQKAKKLDDDLAKKQQAIQVKEFNRQKQIQAIQTLMAGARAAIEAFATLGPVAGAIAGIAIATATTAEVAFIESQKPPKYGKGGALNGPKHDSESNGMPIINPITGEAQAYVEGGEGILMARAMDDRRIFRVMGTPSQIASRLNSEYGGVNWESGASLHPVWVNNPYSLDVPRILNTYSQSRTFGRGGRFESADGSKSQEEDISLKLLKEQNALLQKQVQLLSMPTRSYVVLSDINQQQQRLSAIQNDATMR